MDLLTIDRQQMSLRARLVSELRTLILDGRYEPGQRLVERDLTEHFGVSRPLLREAIQQLCAEGLITTALHRGPSVAVMSEREATEIYRLRALLESEAGRAFVVHADQTALEELQAAVTLLRSDEVQRDVRLQLAAKNRFYEVLLAGAGNGTLARLLEQLNNRVTLLRRVSLASPGRGNRAALELQLVVEAARDRDAERVSELLAEHVANAAALALTHFEESDIKA